MRVRYRLRQFWQEVWAKPLSPSQSAEVQSLLSAAEYHLFCRFSPGDQQHSYRVMHQLQQNEHTQPDLLQAALLHDIGKTRTRLRVWDRSLVVLGCRFAPKKATEWGNSADLHALHKGFVVKAHHPAWGAAMAAAAGSSTRTVALIRRHQDKLDQIITEEDHLLQLLQTADNQS